MIRTIGSTKLSNQSGMSMIELIVSTCAGLILLLILVTDLANLRKESTVNSLANDVEESRRLYGLLLQTRIRSAILLDTWLNTPIATALKLPLPNAISGGVYPGGFAFLDYALGPNGIVAQPGMVVLAFLSSDETYPDVVISPDKTVLPVQNHFPILGATPTIISTPPLSASTTPAGSLIFLGTPAGAIFCKFISVAGQKTTLSFSGLGTFTIDSVTSNSPVGIVSAGSFVGKPVVYLVGVDVTTSTLQVVRLDSSSPNWKVLEQTQLKIDSLQFDPTATAPPISKIVTFRPGSREHSILINTKRTLLTGIVDKKAKVGQPYEVTPTSVLIAL